MSKSRHSKTAAISFSFKSGVPLAWDTINTTLYSSKRQLNNKISYSLLKTLTLSKFMFGCKNYQQSDSLYSLTLLNC